MDQLNAAQSLRNLLWSERSKIGRMVFFSQGPIFYKCFATHNYVHLQYRTSEHDFDFVRATMLDVTPDYVRIHGFSVDCVWLLTMVVHSFSNEAIQTLNKLSHVSK